jgi:flagellar basal-body rod protein FlgC
MSLMAAIEVGASGLAAQRKRLEVHVSNLANVNSTQPAGMEPFRAKSVVFTATNPSASFGAAFDDAVQGVEISGIVADPSDPEKKYEPNHPHADEKGYVLYPNVNPVKEMGNVLIATRSYEANLQGVNMAKEMLQKTLEILR